MVLTTVAEVDMAIINGYYGREWTTRRRVMTTLTISYFKNHALRLLDTVASKGEELVITRRGKPLARVEPMRGSKTIELGKLKGSMEIRGDIVTPLGADDWSACK